MRVFFYLNKEGGDKITTIKIKDYYGNLIYVDVSRLTLNGLIELRKELVGYSAYSALTSMIVEQSVQLNAKNYNRNMKNKRKTRKKYKKNILKG